MWVYQTGTQSVSRYEDVSRAGVVLGSVAARGAREE
jgi:hypothetical protein